MMIKKTIAVCLTALTMFAFAAGPVSAASEADEEALISTYASQFEELTY